MSLLTQAQLLLGNDRVEPAEQRYILAEMVRYFSHPAVGVSTFDRMNSEWKDVNAQVQAGAKLSKSAPAVENTVAAWHQEGRDTCLRSEEHTSELQSLMRISYAVFFLKKTK